MNTTEWIPKDVFISYRRDERPRVLLIVHMLEQFGLTIWFDATLEPGSTFDEEIAREITSARAVLVCWSKGAVASRWVRSEAMLAGGRRVLIPVSLESCELLPPFNLDHTEDLSDWSGEFSHPGWLKILSRIGALVGRKEALVKWAVAQSSKNAEAYREFLKGFPTDPLAGAAKQRVWDIELATVRQHLADELGFLPSEESASSRRLQELTVQLERADARTRDAEDRCSRAQARVRVAEERLVAAHVTRSSPAEKIEEAATHLDATPVLSVSQLVSDETAQNSDSQLDSLPRFSWWPAAVVLAVLLVVLGMAIYNGTH